MTLDFVDQSFPMPDTHETPSYANVRIRGLEGYARKHEPRVATKSHENPDRSAKFGYVRHWSAVTYESGEGFSNSLRSASCVFATALKSRCPGCATLLPARPCGPAPPGYVAAPIPLG